MNACPKLAGRSRMKVRADLKRPSKKSKPHEAGIMHGMCYTSVLWLFAPMKMVPGHGIQPGNNSTKLSEAALKF